MIRDHDLELNHMTYADPRLVHQVVFLLDHRGPRAQHIGVSCNCLRWYRKPNMSVVHDSMGTSANLDEARALYDNPANHREPFTEEDKARW